MLIALAYGLISFVVGAMLGSSLKMTVRILPVTVWIVPTVFLAFSSGGAYFVVGTLCYGLASTAIGFWACRH